MKFNNEDKNIKVSNVLDTTLEEAYLNKKIIENIFKYFIVGIGIFICAIIIYFYFFKTISPGSNFIWGIFLLQTIFFIIGRYLPQTRTFAGISLFIISFALGLSLMPVLTQINAEFGKDFIGKALAVCCMSFAGFSIIGWHNEKFMAGFSGLIKYACLLLLFFAVISRFVNWNNEIETAFSVGAILFIGFVTIFDFQKLRYYPMRAALNASVHLFSDLFILFIFILRLFSSLYRV